MDAAQALADLAEISSQIAGAVLAGADGTVVASTLADEGKTRALVDGAIELVRGAEAARSGEPPVQLQAETPEGSVFVVRDDRHVVAAVTGREPTVGLVFYDLKTCLRLVGEEKPEKPARGRHKKEEASSGEA
jgi:predicted regulator of Ras-like GTPase activity (Roadblock/LC7/MglB family)